MSAGQTSRFRQPSGIFSGKHSFIRVLGLSKNPSSPVYGNTVVAAVTSAIRENGSKRAYFSHSAWGSPNLSEANLH